MSDKQHGAELNAIVPWDQIDALFTGEYLLQRIASLGPEDYHAVAEFLRENPDDTVPCPRCGKRTWRGLRCVHCKAKPCSCRVIWIDEGDSMMCGECDGKGWTW